MNLKFITRYQAAEMLGMTVSGIDYLRRVGRKKRDGSRIKLTPVSRGKYQTNDVTLFKKEKTS